MPVLTAPLLEWALWYASLGHPVFPCHTPIPKGCSCANAECTDIGKHPRINAWQNQATTDRKTITRWWSMWPLANIALCTGVSCFALDIDPRHGGDETLRDLEALHDPLPPTPTSNTGGGGWHRLFAMDGSIRNKINLAPGLDIRGEGGYIIVPPSLHASGQHYTWDPTADLEDVPLTDAPEWLLKHVHEGAYEAPTAPDAPILRGARNNTLSRMAYAMRKAGMSMEGMYPALQVENKRCQPPLDEEELKRIVLGKESVRPDPILRTHPREKDEPKEWPSLIPGNTILGASYKLTAWLIQGLIPEGLTIIGGLPKVAKSYFAYDIALACGGQGLGLGHFGVTPGRVAYLAIEDDAADTQQRIWELRPGITELANVFFLHGEAVPSISDGLVDYLRLKVTAHDLSLVIIDPLSYVYDPKIGKQTDSFREAKEMLLPLRQLARELHFSLVFVDHRRKQSKDDADVFQTLYGSVAKYALADAMIMIVRRDEEVTLHCRGRKIKDQVITCELAFVDGHAYWKVHAAQEALSSENLRNKILNAFKDAERLTNKRAFPLNDIMDYAEVEHSPQMKETFRVTMFRMCKEGLLVKGDRNVFLLAGDDDEKGIVV